MPILSFYILTQCFQKTDGKSRDFPLQFAEEYI